jgi:hypothetical protein
MLALIGTSFLGCDGIYLTAKDLPNLLNTL